jgi:hypothetical protein
MQIMQVKWGDALFPILLLLKMVEISDKSAMKHIQKVRNLG